MKRTLLVLAGLAFMAACSSPKYTYNFGHYNYNAGKKHTSSNTEFVANEGLKAIQPDLLTASVSNEVNNEEMASPIVEAKATSKKSTYAQMTKTERKALRTFLKTEVKNSIKVKKASIEGVSSAKGMDSDLKLAAIFGAVGLVALIISGQVFYIIGGIALLIGVVFFVKWLIRQ